MEEESFYSPAVYATIVCLICGESFDVTDDYLTLEFCQSCAHDIEVAKLIELNGRKPKESV